MANGLGVSKEQFLAGDRDIRDGVLYDNIVYLRETVDSLNGKAWKYGLIGGASAAGAMTAVALVAVAMQAYGG